MSTTCCGTAKFNVLTKECKTGTKFLHFKFKFNFALCLFKKQMRKAIVLAVSSGSVSEGNVPTKKLSAASRASWTHIVHPVSFASNFLLFKNRQKFGLMFA